ncbi:unnamed protein product [Amoebophrya sp. A25]|nr:unnamed protein product [Amoebophrya sp. A25]|eukprot:GSA25T00021347001.1
MPSGGSGPVVPALPLVDQILVSNAFDRKHLGDDDWGGGLSPAPSARAASIARTRDDESKSNASLAPPYLDERTAAVRRLTDIRPAEYIRVFTSSARVGSAGCPLRLWHNGGSGAVSRAGRVSTVEGVLFDGVPCFTYDAEREKFDRRWVKLDPSYNFLYFLTTNLVSTGALVPGSRMSGLVQQARDAAKQAATGVGAATDQQEKMSAARAANQPADCIAVRMDKIGNIVGGQRAFDICVEHLLIRDHRLNARDVIILVRKSLTKKRGQDEGGRKPPVSGGLPLVEGLEDRALQLGECTILLAAPQSHLKRCLNVAIAKSPSISDKHHGAVLTIMGCIRNRLLRKLVKVKNKVLESVRIWQNPRRTFFVELRALDLQLEFRNMATPLAIQIPMKGSKTLDQRGTAVSTREAVLAAIKKAKPDLGTNCVASVQSIAVEVTDVRSTRGLTQRTGGALWLVQEVILSPLQTRKTLRKTRKKEEKAASKINLSKKAAEQAASPTSEEGRKRSGFAGRRPQSVQSAPAPVEPGSSEDEDKNDFFVSTTMTDAQLDLAKRFVFLHEYDGGLGARGRKMAFERTDAISRHHQANSPGKEVIPAIVPSDSAARSFYGDMLSSLTSNAVGAPTLIDPSAAFLSAGRSPMAADAVPLPSEAEHDDGLIDFKEHGKLLDVLASADLYYFVRDARSLRGNFETDEAKEKTIEHVREEMTSLLDTYGKAVDPRAASGAAGGSQDAGDQTSSADAAALPGAKANKASKAPRASMFDNSTQVRMFDREPHRISVAERLRERERVLPPQMRWVVRSAHKVPRCVQLASHYCAELDYKLKQLLQPEKPLAAAPFSGGGGGGGDDGKGSSNIPNIAASSGDQDDGPSPSGRRRAEGEARQVEESGEEEGVDDARGQEQQTASGRLIAGSRDFLLSAMSCTTKDSGQS